jgi:hypothetical protein
MRKFTISSSSQRISILGILLFSLSSLPTFAQNPAAASSTVPVTTTVTVLGPKNTAPPPLTKDDIIVFSGKTRLNVIGWAPAQGQSPRNSLQLAILIDNAVSAQELGPQFNDLKQFIVAQSKNTAVGLFYAENGTVQQVSPFDTNHDAVAKKIRLPFGRFDAASPSIYLSLRDLIAKWPASYSRREVLMISSGFDRLNPGIDDPYFDSTVTAAQRTGTVVHTIYVGSGRFGASIRGGNSQSKLQELTHESGGQGYFEGLAAPVAFSPFLNELDMVLQNQYQLTVAMPRSKKTKGEMRPLKITTESRNVMISAPTQVHVPGTAK